MGKRIIYTSDLHGNLEQYNKLVEYCIKTNPYALVIGGDIAPKGESVNYIRNQRNFLESLPKIFKPLKDISIYLMMGNDDCKSNMDVLFALEKKGLFKLINKARLSLDNDFEIVGYSNVPITPFGIKDWEKFDLTNVPKKFEDFYYKRLKSDVRFDGFKSVVGKFHEFNFKKDMFKHDSIELDLEKDLFTNNPGKTVYILHTPPYNTNLDLISSKIHVGSIASRLFIEKYQPYLTLHGHIHETVDVSGNFFDNIGKTICLSSGNHNVGGKLCLIDLDLERPGDAKRFII